MLVGRETEGAAMIRCGFDRYDALGVLGSERPQTVAAKVMARIKRQMGDAQGCN
jgi:hypothetical protein